MQTIIDSPRQRQLELLKPRFQFYFADEPQFATYDKRGRIAHMLKNYRAHPEMYELRRHGLHHYSVRVVGSTAVAVIIAD